MRDLPSLNALRVFESAARHLNFTRAARELHVTQGAVSRQIIQLEEQLQTRLFVRHGPKITLTEAGLQYFRTVEEALGVIRRGTRAITAHDSAATLTLSVLPFFASSWLVARTAMFHQQHPDFSVRLAASYEVVDFSRSSDIDAAIRYGRGDWGNLFRVRLMEERIFPVCSPRFYRENDRPGSPEEVANCPLVLMTERYDEWPDWFASAGVAPPRTAPRPRYNELLMLYRAAMEHQGIALGRSMSAAGDLDAGRLMRLTDHSIVSTQNYHFVCRPGDEKAPKIATFLNWVTAEARASSAEWAAA